MRPEAGEFKVTVADPQGKHTHAFQSKSLLASMAMMAYLYRLTSGASFDLRP